MTVSSGSAAIRTATKESQTEETLENTEKNEAKNPWESFHVTVTVVSFFVGIFVAIAMMVITAVNMDAAPTRFTLGAWNSALERLSNGPASLLNLPIWLLSFVLDMVLAVSITLVWPAGVALIALLFGAVGMGWCLVFEFSWKGVKYCHRLLTQKDDSRKV